MDLVEQHALLEGAKFDLLMKNFLKEGKDYKGLKADLKEIIDANDLDDSKLASKGKSLLHICKRVLQICYDIGAAIGTGGTAVSLVAGAVGMLAAGTGPMALIPIIYGIVNFVIAFIINRLIRLLVDHIEFDTVKKTLRILFLILESRLDLLIIRSLLTSIRLKPISLKQPLINIVRKIKIKII